MVTLMVHEPTESESIGMIELTTPEGGVLWVKPDALYSIEKSPKEQNSVIKLLGDGGAMAGVIMVAEVPETIAAKVQSLQSARHQPTRDEVLAMVTAQITEAENVAQWRAEGYEREQVAFVRQPDLDPFVIMDVVRLPMEQTLDEWKRANGYPVGDEDDDDDDE